MFVVYCSVCADDECRDGERSRVQVLAHGYSRSGDGVVLGLQ